jgi:APA family basic amino acid/polyamine antiporter
VLPRTRLRDAAGEYLRDPQTGQPLYGNLYSNLLDYVVSAALLFYILTIAAVFRLRRARPEAGRPYRVPLYPLLPALYIAGAVVVLGMLFAYRPATTWPGLVIVLLGGLLYLGLRKQSQAR